MTLVICMMPECQTSAGCICAHRIAPSKQIFVCSLVHSAPRGSGWYWWPERADDRMAGPFETEDDARGDIDRVSREADGQ